MRKDGRIVAKYRIYQKLKCELLETIIRTETGGKEISVLYDQPGRDQRIAALQFEIHRRRGLSLL